VRRSNDIAFLIWAAAGIAAAASLAFESPTSRTSPCVGPCKFSEVVAAYDGVAMNLPPEMRTQNWGGGSCVHASTVSLLRWQGQDQMADWWRNEYSGGEGSDRLVQRMDAAGVKYAHTGGLSVDGKRAFLKECCDKRLGAGIFYKPNHAINLVGMDDQYAYLLDNNATTYAERNGHYERVELNEFFRRWEGYGSFGWTLAYVPPPPVPY